jgi:hypothetical protein
MSKSTIRDDPHFKSPQMKTLHPLKAFKETFTLHLTEKFGLYKSFCRSLQA